MLWTMGFLEFFTFDKDSWSVVNFLEIMVVCLAREFFLLQFHNELGIVI